jgi:hypothetical protein
MMRAKVFRTLAGLIVVALFLSIGVCLRDGALLPAVVSLPPIVLFAAYAIVGERVNKIISRASH